MWEPVVIIALVMGAVAILSNVLSVTVFVVRLGGKIDLNNSTVIGKIDVIDLRVKGVETGIADLKNTDRRLSLSGLTASPCHPAGEHGAG